MCCRDDDLGQRRKKSYRTLQHNHPTSEFPISPSPYGLDTTHILHSFAMGFAIGILPQNGGSKQRSIRKKKRRRRRRRRRHLQSIRVSERHERE
jgi:hypothetical protein